jgi:acyl-CoA reductase-like NAD-dependent aldehyde dehydrogenase
MATRYDLEQPETRMALIGDFVEGADSGPTLARRYGVTTQSIYQFKTRHAEEIAAALQLVRQALAETWTAVKAERVAALQSDIELIDDWLRRDGLDVAELTSLVRERRAHLRAIAEELGDIPRGRLGGDEDGLVVRYVIDGVDLGAI